ncbi:HIT-like protein [Periconia macrospinosa]|uniref:HIT-like protein n=1 Tax=Periconia macrospinosa TaxID=97972 RepID=A0A2V1DI37_9PLEO|nr:HIT-like protein [Periconia macrospinosa]
MRKMLLNLSESLPNLVRAKYKEAKASEALVFSPTEVDVIRTSAGIPFQLRYCPSLAKKPEPHKEKKKDNEEPKKEKFDPFDNPSPSLFITDIPSSTTAKPSHLLVLNKFPVIQNHFIIATKENKPQTHRLEEDDLEATYACLKAWEQDGEDENQEADSTTQEKNSEKRLFAFFNSGNNSGASQPHRHIQFLPVEDMREDKRADQKEGPTWDLLVDTILSNGVPTSSSLLPSLSTNKPIITTNTIEGVIHHPALPFLHFAHRFTSSSPSGPQLLQMYNKLYNLALEAMQNVTSNNTPTTTQSPDILSIQTPQEETDLPISYNLAMTTSGMAILPRRSEGSTLHDEDGSQAGYVQLNGTALGGTLMVKYAKEWDVLRNKSEAKLDGILSAIGIPNPSLYPTPPPVASASASASL